MIAHVVEERLAAALDGEVLSDGDDAEFAPTLVGAMSKLDDVFGAEPDVLETSPLDHSVLDALGTTSTLHRSSTRIQSSEPWTWRRSRTSGLPRAAPSPRTSFGGCSRRAAQIPTRRLGLEIRPPSRLHAWCLGSVAGRFGEPPT